LEPPNEQELVKEIFPLELSEILPVRPESDALVLDENVTEELAATLL
jgi:hypothetical protein